MSGSIGNQVSQAVSPRSTAISNTIEAALSNMGQSNPGVAGNVWGTNGTGIASPQAGRPAMSGGLQPLQMLQAYRSGASSDQLQAMNPYTARPTQFLPQAMPTTHYAPQVAAAPAPWTSGSYPGYMAAQMSGGPGGGTGVGGSGGNAAAASSDSGQDGSAAAVGGGDGGGGGGGGK